MHPACPLSDDERAGIEAEAERIGAFLGLEPQPSSGVRLPPMVPEAPLEQTEAGVSIGAGDGLCVADPLPPGVAGLGTRACLS